MLARLRPGNTTRISIEGLRDQASGLYVNNATAEVTITDIEGVEIEGETWPLELTYEEDSDGNYSAEVDYLAEISPGYRYTINITATAGSKRGTWNVRARAETRIQ